jgi:hypothetical protein
MSSILERFSIFGGCALALLGSSSTQAAEVETDTVTLTTEHRTMISEAGIESSSHCRHSSAGCGRDARVGADCPCAFLRGTAASGELQSRRCPARVERRTLESSVLGFIEDEAIAFGRTRAPGFDRNRFFRGKRERVIEETADA